MIWFLSIMGGIGITFAVFVLGHIITPEVEITDKGRRVLPLKDRVMKVFSLSRAGMLGFLIFELVMTFVFIGFVHSQLTLREDNRAVASQCTMLRDYSLIDDSPRHLCVNDEMWNRAKALEQSAKELRAKAQHNPQEGDK